MDKEVAVGIGILGGVGLGAYAYKKGWLDWIVSRFSSESVPETQATGNPNPNATVFKQDDERDSMSSFNYTPTERVKSDWVMDRKTKNTKTRPFF